MGYKRGKWGGRWVIGHFNEVLRSVPILTLLFTFYSLFMRFFMPRQHFPRRKIRRRGSRCATSFISATPAFLLPPQRRDLDKKAAGASLRYAKALRHKEINRGERRGRKETRCPSKTLITQFFLATPAVLLRITNRRGLRRASQIRRRLTLLLPGLRTRHDQFSKRCLCDWPASSSAKSFGLHNIKPSKRHRFN